MYWEILKPVKLHELVEYEKNIFDPEDCSTVDEYEDHIKNSGLKIHVLRDSLSPPQIIGCFQVLPREDAMYMCGFSVHPDYRGGTISKTVMKELIRIYAKYGIVCKTLANHPAMRKLLRQSGWTNRMDRFEKGILWSWWYIDTETIREYEIEINQISN